MWIVYVNMRNLWRSDNSFFERYSLKFLNIWIKNPDLNKNLWTYVKYYKLCMNDDNSFLEGTIISKSFISELKILMKICVCVEYCKSYMNYIEDNFNLFDYT